MSRGQHVGIHILCALCLPATVLHKRSHSLLNNLHNVVFELCKVLLHGDQVLAVVVLLQDLFVQTIIDAALGDVGVFVGVNFVLGGFGGGGLGAEELDLLLG